MARKYRDEEKVHNVAGKKSQIVEWGRLRVYFKKGKWADFNRATKKIQGVGPEWKLYKSTDYDQIEKFADLSDGERKKYQRIAIEQFDQVVSHYASHGWSDPVLFVAYALDAGRAVHLLIADDDKAKEVFLSIVNKVQEIADGEDEEI